MDLVRQGKNIVVVTGTASGKTLCYNLPVLEAWLQDGEQGPVPLPHQGAGARPAQRVTAADGRLAAGAGYGDL